MTTGVVVLSTDIAIEVAVPVLSRAGARTPAALHAVATHLVLQPRYQRRDVTGDDKPETFCNFLVREALRMLGVDIPRMLANNFRAHFSKPETMADGWTWVPLWVARSLAELGHPVVAVQENPTGSGHVALLQPANNDDERRQALQLDSAWICQAGTSNFAHGLLMQGFRRGQPITFWAHP